VSNTFSVLDQTCQFFGGAYDSTTHTYRTPTVAGLSVVRRATPKRDDFQEYVVGQPPGTMTGAIMLVWIPTTHDHRAALPAVSGRREVFYGIELHNFIWSKASFAEDCQDFVYQLEDAIKAKIRTDPTLGSGGFEAGAFHAGEGPAGGIGDIDTEYQQGAMKNEGTKAYLRISFTATAYETG
jgi:hypothetical protein